MDCRLRAVLVFCWPPGLQPSDAAFFFDRPVLGDLSTVYVLTCCCFSWCSRASARCASFLQPWSWIPAAPASTSCWRRRGESARSAFSMPLPPTFSPSSACSTTWPPAVGSTTVRAPHGSWYDLSGDGILRSLPSLPVAWAAATRLRNGHAPSPARARRGWLLPRRLSRRAASRRRAAARACLHCRVRARLPPRPRSPRGGASPASLASGRSSCTGAPRSSVRSAAAGFVASIGPLRARSDGLPRASAPPPRRLRPASTSCVRADARAP